MTRNRGSLGSDLAKVDDYENTAADYDGIPDMADVDPALVTWEIGGVRVSEARGACRHGGLGVALYSQQAELRNVLAGS